jgi:glycosyltransferase involved in cell wall biosynthesis
MHVALDASNLAKKAPTGVAVYGIRLIDQIAALDRENRYTLCYRLSRWKDRRYFHRVDQDNFRTKIIQEPLNLFFAKRVDLFHGLDARMYDSPRVRNVVTIHDLPQYSNLYSGTRHPERKFRLYADIMARADRIIANSVYTKADILRFYSIPEERIDVVPHGVDVPARSIGAGEVQAVLARYGIRAPYLLHVGRIETKKNLCRTLEAFAGVRKQSAEPVQLVLAGTPGPGAEEVFHAIEAFRLREEVRATGYVRKEDLPALYAGAIAFLFPSLYEGFGMPVLEAMACGTPVLASSVTSLPEVAGDAALMVDPLDAGSIAHGMLRLMEEPGLRDGYIRKGLERVKEFTWERTARETLAVYRKTLGLA